MNVRLQRVVVCCVESCAQIFVAEGAKLLDSENLIAVYCEKCEPFVTPEIRERDEARGETLRTLFGSPHYTEVPDGATTTKDRVSEALVDVMEKLFPGAMQNLLERCEAFEMKLKE